MSWLESVRACLPAPQLRTEAQVDAEVDEELAFHLGQLERELVQTGLDPESARAQALARFGDPAAIRNRCRRIAMGDRIMLQRINFMLMLVVLAAVAFLGVQSFVTQRHNAAALRDITQRLALASPGTAVPTSSLPATSEKNGILYVAGAVKRPGMYALPPSGRLTLTRLIAAAGGLDELHSLATVRVVRTADGETWTVFEQTIADEADIATRDFRLQADDRVIVSRAARGPGSADDRKLTELPGRWRPASDGPAPDPGAVLEIIGTEDIKNLSGTPTGTLNLPLLGLRLDLCFLDRSPATNNLLVSIPGAPGLPIGGRWQLEDGKLLLNLASMAPDQPALQAPLVFVKD
jgi:SLBB domain-containing protein